MIIDYSNNSSDKINIFTCHYHYFQYQAASTRIMKIQKSNILDNNEKYSCDVCGHQVSHKKNLARHKKIVHEGVRHHCRQCNYQATDVGSLARHKRAVHEGLRYSCNQCDHKATTKGDLTKHKRSVH